MPEDFEQLAKDLLEREFEAGKIKDYLANTFGRFQLEDAVEAALRAGVNPSEISRRIGRFGVEDAATQVQIATKRHKTNVAEQIEEELEAEELGAPPPPPRLGTPSNAGTTQDGLDSEEEAIAGIEARLSSEQGGNWRWVGQNQSGEHVFRNQFTGEELKFTSDLNSIVSTGSGGGSTRIEFESERRLRQAQVDEINARIGQDRFETRPDGSIFDNFNGTLIDTSQIGFSDRQLDELARQFDITEGRLGERLNLDRDRLGLDTARDLGRLALDQAAQEAEILRNPADFLFRAFTTRGEESPFPRITHGDLITRLRDELRDAVTGPPQPARPSELTFNAAGLSPEETDRRTSEALGSGRLTFDTGAQAAFDNAVAAAQAAAADAQAAGRTPISTQADITAAADLASRQTQLNTLRDAPSLVRNLLQGQIDERKAAGAGAPLRFARGGTTSAKRLVVGDADDGEPNPEIIENPTGAPLKITSPRLSAPIENFRQLFNQISSDLMNAPRISREQMLNAVITGRLPSGLPEDEVEAALQREFDLLTFAERFKNRKTPVQPNLNREEQRAGRLQDLPRFQFGTTSTNLGGGLTSNLTTFKPQPKFDFSHLFNLDPVTQQQIQQNARTASPPAVRDILQNRTPADFRTQTRLFTPRQLAALTRGEGQALNTRLLAEEDVPLEDFLFNIQQRFGGQRARARGRLSL